MSTYYSDPSAPPYSVPMNLPPNNSISNNQYNYGNGNNNQHNYGNGNNNQYNYNNQYSGYGNPPQPQPPPHRGSSGGATTVNRTDGRCNCCNGSDFCCTFLSCFCCGHGNER